MVELIVAAVTGLTGAALGCLATTWAARQQINATAAVAAEQMRQAARQQFASFTLQVRQASVMFTTLELNDIEWKLDELKGGHTCRPDGSHVCIGPDNNENVQYGRLVARLIALSTAHAPIISTELQQEMEALIDAINGSGRGWLTSAEDAGEEGCEFWRTLDQAAEACSNLKERVILRSPIFERAEASMPSR